MEPRPEPTEKPSLLRIWILVGFLGLFATGVWTLAVADRRPVAAHPWPVWAVCVLFVVGKQLKVELSPSGAQRMSLVMTDAALVLSFLLAEPLAIPLAIAVAAVVDSAAHRAPLVKGSFNLAQEVFGAGLGYLLFEFIRDSQRVSTRTGLGALAGGLVVGVVSHVCVLLVTTLAGGGRDRAPLRSLVVSSIGSLGNGVVALQGVYLATISLPLGLTPIALIGVLLATYRLVERQQVKSDRSDLLYRTTAALHEQTNVDVGFLDVLAELRKALRANQAKLLLITGDGVAGCSVEADITSPMASVTGDVATATRDLAESLPGTVRFAIEPAAGRRGPITHLASEDGIVAPLTRASESAGLLILSGRSGAADELSSEDVELVNILARQISLVLEKGFLERSLSQLMELELQLTHQAFYDAVTGLPNRHFLNEELERIYASENVGSRAIVLLDLDDFKLVNDSLGHIAGDQLLGEIASRLRTITDSAGTVIRVGGDEFAVITDNELSPSGLSQLAEQLIAAVSDPVLIDGREVCVGASAGIRAIDKVSNSAAEPLRDADLALYKAKAEGKGHYRHFEPSMHIEARDRLQLTNALGAAVDREEFTLHFQPIVDLQSLQVRGFEALVRWRHPERGELGPAHFLALTEQSGLIVLLGKNILRLAIEALAHWRAQHSDANLYVSVNVSARQLREPGFAEMVVDLLSSSGVPPTALTLEITESMLIDDVTRTKQVLQELSDTGVRISIDDFGTGYSSLSQIELLPFHQLKVDQSFVRRLGDGRDAHVVVRAILQLAGSMGLDVVAEGIETQEQLDKLRRLGCTKGQGWLFAKAQPIEEVSTFISTWRSPTRLVEH